DGDHAYCDSEWGAVRGGSACADCAERGNDTRAAGCAERLEVLDAVQRQGKGGAGLYGYDDAGYPGAGWGVRCGEGVFRAEADGGVDGYDCDVQHGVTFSGSVADSYA